MSKREQHRVHVLTQVQHDRLRAAAAAQLLGLSLRHLRRLLARLRRQGLAALVHGNRGRPSPRRLTKAVRSRVLTLARTTYAGFNDHHLTEMLVQHEGLRLSRRTVQRLLLFLSRDQRGTDRYPRGRRRRYAPNPARPMASSRSNPVTTVWDWWVDRVASAETAAIPSTTNAKTMPSSHQRFIAVILTPPTLCCRFDVRDSNDGIVQFAHVPRVRFQPCRDRGTTLSVECTRTTL